MNKKVQEMIKDALQSDGVEEIFKLGENTEAEQDIFDEDYLAKISKIKLPNTKIKLLQQLLAKVIGEIKKVNKVKGVDFGDQIVIDGVGLLRVTDVYSTDRYYQCCNTLRKYHLPQEPTREYFDTAKCFFV